MSRIGIFFAEGYEEVEALTVVDLARRAGLEIDMISVTGGREVTGSHGITVKMDKVFSEVDFGGLDMLVLPGGLPGTKNLENCKELMEKLDEFYNPHHKAILKMIQMVVDNAHKYGKWAGICGELGADPELTKKFIRMGVDELSVAPSMILKLRKQIREMAD